MGGGVYWAVVRFAFLLIYLLTLLFFIFYFFTCLLTACVLVPRLLILAILKQGLPYVNRSTGTKYFFFFFFIVFWLAVLRLVVLTVPVTVLVQLRQLVF